MQRLDRKRQVGSFLGNNSVTKDFDIAVRDGEVVIIPSLNPVTVNTLALTKIVTIRYPVVRDSDMAGIMLNAIASEIVDLVSTD